VIGRLEGVVVERALDGACIVDVNGVGYEVWVPMGALARVGDGERVVLWVHTHVREDALVLYGFASPDDRATFRALLGVSSVGPKIALAILSQMSARDLAIAIAKQDVAAFKGISGVGKKIAERLVLELRDKLLVSPSSAGFVAAASKPVAPRMPEGPLGTVTMTLVQMGFKPAEAERAVALLADRAEGKTVESLLREALASLG